jgi:hypothetical protein
LPLLLFAPEVTRHEMLINDMQRAIDALAGRIKRPRHLEVAVMAKLASSTPRCAPC